MKSVPLGEVVDFYSGGTPSKARPELWHGDVPWFSAKDLKRDRLGDSIDHIANDVFTSTSLRRLPAGTVAIVVRGMILAHTVPISILEVDAAINQDLKALIPKQAVDPSFLAAMLRAQQATILSQVSTAAHGTKKIESRVLENLQIPLPPLAEQRRIAAILDHADALRAKRRQVLAHLDALTGSIFNEMFPSGHFTAMPAGTLMPEMRNGLSPASGGSYSAKVLTLSAVTQGAFDPSAVKAGAFAFEPPAEKRISERDFLMCRGNGNKSLVGVGTYSRENRPDLVFPDTVIAGAVDTSLVTLPFLEAAWKHRDVRAQVEAVARTTNGTYKVNQGTLSGVLVPVPPLDEQETFGARIEHVNRQRASALAATSACDELFASLQARAFSGEL